MARKDQPIFHSPIDWGKQTVQPGACSGPPHNEARMSRSACRPQKQASYNEVRWIAPKETSTASRTSYFPLAFCSSSQTYSEQTSATTAKQILHVFLISSVYTFTSSFLLPKAIRSFHCGTTFQLLIQHGKAALSTQLNVYPTPVSLKPSKHSNPEKKNLKKKTEQKNKPDASDITVGRINFKGKIRAITTYEISQVFALKIRKMDIAMFKTGAALTIPQRSERGTSLAERMEDGRKDDDDNVDYYYYSLNTTYYHQSWWFRDLWEPVRAVRVPDITLSQVQQVSELSGRGCCTATLHLLSSSSQLSGLSM